MTIAVLDEDPGSSSSLLRMLTDLGYDATPTRTDRTAVYLIAFRAETWRRSLATMEDELDRSPAVLIMYEEQPSPDDLIEAMRLGATDVIHWPFDEDELASVMDRNLLRARVRQVADPAVQQHMKDLERDQRAGHYIQMGMLPPNPMAIDRYRLCHRIHPSLLLSGDFVDYFRLADHYFLFYIADVSGHGASSAFVTVILKNFSRRLRREYHPRMLTDPGEILVWLNREMLENDIDKHVAMFVGVVDLQSDTMTYANAGHFPHAIHVSGRGANLLELTGKPIGLFDTVTYNSGSTQLAEGDTLVMVSDGVLEVMNESGLREKEQRLIDGARACAADIETLWDLIGVGATVAGPDDITCLMVTREV